MIRVDDMARGCSMKTPSFLQTPKKYLELLAKVIIEVKGGPKRSLKPRLCVNAVLISNAAL